MLKVLRQIIQEVSAANDFDVALQILVYKIKQAMQADAVTIFLVDKERDDFVLIATEGLNKDECYKARIPINKGLLGIIAQREELIHVIDAQEHPDFYHIPLLNEEKYQGYLGIPIIQHRLLYGVIVAQQYQSVFFDDEVEAFLTTLAAQLGGMIAHAQATGHINKRLDEKLNNKNSINAELSRTLQGIGASSGIGIGVGLVIYPIANIDVVPMLHAEDVKYEQEIFFAALDKVREEINKLHQRMKIRVTDEEHELFDVYSKILERDNLGAEVIALIEEQKISAQSALSEVIKRHMLNFYAIDNDYLRQRASDLRDLGQRVLAELQRQQKQTIEYPKKVVLIGQNIHASDLAEVPDGQLIGIISQEGGIHSHVAILARAMGIPMVVGAIGLDLDKLNNCFLIIDGTDGQVYLDPNNNTLTEFNYLLQKQKDLDEYLIALRDQEAKTTDDHKVNLQVNIGVISDISTALSACSEGVGLYRSEMNFFTRESFPAEEDQMILYRQVLKAFAPRIVTIRTLDVGGDKPLPYFPIKEVNPYLGWRGIRLTLDHPEIFLIQLRALLRASESFNNLQILLPMVTWRSEIIEAKELIHQAYQELLEEQYKIIMPKIGVMIETPAMAMQIANLKELVDFISIGSNDLTQYWLAVDRNNTFVARMYQYLHPTILNLLFYIAKEAEQYQIPLSLCGEMASDPYAAILLIAMGYNTLSLNALNLPRIKAIIREVSLKELQKLLKSVLLLQNHEMVHQTLHDYFVQKDILYLLN